MTAPGPTEPGLADPPTRPGTRASASTLGYGQTSFGPSTSTCSNGACADTALPQVAAVDGVSSTVTGSLPTQRWAPATHARFT